MSLIVTLVGFKVEESMSIKKGRKYIKVYQNTKWGRSRQKIILTRKRQEKYPRNTIICRRLKWKRKL